MKTVLVDHQRFKLIEEYMDNKTKQIRSLKAMIKCLNTLIVSANESIKSLTSQLQSAASGAKASIEKRLKTAEEYAQRHKNQIISFEEEIDQLECKVS